MSIELLSFLGQSLTAFVANFIFFLFYKNIYGSKYTKRRYYIVGYCIFVTLMIGVNQIGNPYLNMVYSLISDNTICLILFESNIKKIWLHNLLFWFLFVFTDVITVLMWSVIEENTLNGILSNYQLMLGSNILNIIFMFAAYKVYMTFIQKNNFQGLQFKVALFTITVTFFEIWVVATYAAQITERYDGINIIIILVGFLLMNVFLYYVLNQISDSYKYKYELSLAERLNEMHLSNYTEMSHKYEESRAIIHDMKKHLMVADNLKNIDTSEQNHYLTDVYKRMDELFYGFKCSNKILSVVLSQKISYAKSKGINVNISAQDVSMDFIDDFDITAIFANLWDNAIEACDKVDEYSKYITMEVRRHNDFLLINIENSYNGFIKPKKDTYVSVKPNHSGVGLKSIRLAVEKYEGVFLTDHSSKFFRAEITIPII
ncbi:MAG: GHKL domain-containing protein [Oscillospiraceae bacterium]|nr:GHKL domain-containing protein [Oscillospiraceae bacterium]